MPAPAAKLDQIWGQIFFPTIHWVSHLEVEKKVAEKEEVEKEETMEEEEEMMEEEEEEDRDNVQLRGSQSSVSCFSFLL